MPRKFAVVLLFVSIFAFAQAKKAEVPKTDEPTRLSDSEKLLLRNDQVQYLYAKENAREAEDARDKALNKLQTDVQQAFESAKADPQKYQFDKDLNFVLKNTAPPLPPK